MYICRENLSTCETIWISGQVLDIKTAATTLVKQKLLHSYHIWEGIRFAYNFVSNFFNKCSCFMTPWNEKWFFSILSVRLSLSSLSQKDSILNRYWPPSNVEYLTSEARFYGWYIDISSWNFGLLNKSH